VHFITVYQSAPTSSKMW